MEFWEELRHYTGFDREDESRLRLFAPHLLPRRDVVADAFYCRAAEHPATRAFLSDAARLVKQRAALLEWMRDLVTGPWDAAYYARREQIGRTHVRVGLPQWAMVTGMQVLREGLLAVLAETELDRETVAGAITRATEVDLVVMVNTYMSAHEEARMQEMQDLIVRNIPVAVLLLDGAGLCTGATRAVERYYGQEAVLGRHYTEVLPRSVLDGAALEERISRAMVMRQEILLPRVDVEIGGIEKNLAFTIVPIEHRSARVMLHIKDVTDAVQAEARVRRNENLAQLGALSATMAHELRNPLAGISGALQVLASGTPEGDPRRTVMDKVLKQVFRLNSLVGDLLAFARTATARLSEGDLRAVAERAVQPALVEYPAVRVTFSGRGRAEVDADMLHQILLNLVLNACHALDGEGDVLVEIGSGEIVIADSGPGIPEASQARLFEPFFTTKTRGTGLGLAICRKLATAMGATIEFTHHPRLTGAAFRLRFA